MALSFCSSLRRKLLWAMPLFVAAVATGNVATSKMAFAEGFRIETQIFVGEDEQPVSETTTLFLEGVVYDFLKSPAQTAVFRKPGGGKPGRFILDRKSVV